MHYCLSCDKVIFNSTSHICRVCIDAPDSKFSRVRKFLDEHPGASLAEISQETGISTKVILDMVRAGHLRISGD